MTRKEFIQLCDKEDYEIPEDLLNKKLWIERPPLKRKSDGEELSRLWVETEEAKKSYQKALDNVLVSQQVYIAKMEIYNATSIKLLRKEKNK